MKILKQLYHGTFWLSSGSPNISCGKRLLILLKLNINIKLSSKSNLISEWPKCTRSCIFKSKQIQNKLKINIFWIQTSELIKTNDVTDD